MTVKSLNQSNPIKIDKNAGEPLYVQIANGLVSAIKNRELGRGDPLPSLHQLKRDLDVSVNTVVKAYEMLKEKGIIASFYGKGFKVASESIQHRVNVFLLFDELNFFKEDLYRSFLGSLKGKAKVDIFFHYFNPTFFRSLILDNLHSYNKFIIMPPPSKKTHSVLKKIEPRNLLILDQLHQLKGSFSYVCQDFAGDTYLNLKSGESLIKKYNRFNFVVPDPVTQAKYKPYVKEILKGFNQFCDQAPIPTRQIGLNDKHALKKNELYLVISEVDLLQIIKQSRKQGLKLGKDMGLISFNESPYKELVDVGITTLSTDFRKMGLTASEFILENKVFQKTNPSKMIVRNSL